MAKGKRKSGIVPIREPSGRLQRDIERDIGAAHPTVAKRLRDAAMRSMAQPEWGTEIGRLFLEGRIAPVLYEAGKRWAALAEVYHRVTCAPPAGPRAAMFAQVGRGVSPDPDSEEGQRLVERDRRVAEAFAEALAILHALGVARIVRRVCEEGVALTTEADRQQLIRGLSWLSEHWGLIEDKAKRSA